MRGKEADRMESELLNLNLNTESQLKCTWKVSQQATTKVLVLTARTGQTIGYAVEYQRNGKLVVLSVCMFLYIYIEFMYVYINTCIHSYLLRSYTHLTLAFVK